MTTYSYIPEYKTAEFIIPLTFKDFDHKSMTDEEVNYYIWTHNLIKIVDKKEE